MRRSEYDAVYREGRRRTSREFTVFLRPNGLGHSRFGWSIKKALGMRSGATESGDAYAKF